jgi:hypothetical protein
MAIVAIEVADKNTLESSFMQLWTRNENTSNIVQNAFKRKYEAISSSFLYAQFPAR